MTKTFLTSIPNPDDERVKHARKTGGEIATDVPEILQFTQDGLDVAVDYYNQKYDSSRGRINGVTIDIGELDIARASAERNDDFLIERMSGEAAKEIAEIGEGSGFSKLLFTISRCGEISHSNPFLIADGKLICLRDEPNPFGKRLNRTIAEKAGLQLVEPRVEVAESGKIPSFQGDHVSCHMIALGILKDVQGEDLPELAALEDGYITPARFLKYSQSATYVNSTLGEELAKVSAIKDSGTTLAAYVEAGKASESHSRIAQKRQRFIDDVVRHSEGASGEGAESFAKSILQERRVKKEELEKSK